MPLKWVLWVFINLYSLKSRTFAERKSCMMNKSTWLPLALLLAGGAFYVTYGIEYNAWKENLVLMIVDAAICVLLFFVLRLKEKHKN